MNNQQDTYNVIKTLNALKDSIEQDGDTINLMKFVKAYKEIVK